MKLRTTQFRCDLCGKFRNRGVTETRPDATRVLLAGALLPDAGGGAATETTVCDVCVLTASELLTGGHEEEG